MKSCNENAHFEFVLDTAVYSAHSSKKKIIEQYFVEGPSGTFQTLRRRKPGVNRTCFFFRTTLLRIRRLTKINS